MKVIIEKSIEEYIDIFDENNNPTGKVKEKKKAHQDGDYHRTAHVWIINDKNEILLQRKSEKKESNANFLDTSCAGHIMAGETVLQGAIRELKEELNVDAYENELQYITTIKRFKNPKNKEFWYMYLLKSNKSEEEYIFNDEEVSEVKYVYYEELEKMVNEQSEGLLVHEEHEEEYRELFHYIRENIINMNQRKIAIFSDIHGNVQALKTILDDIKKRKIDKIYYLGDVIALGPNPKECLDLIIENNIKMVLGNHELYYLKGTIIDDEMSENEKEHQKWVKEQLESRHKEFLNKCSLKINEKISKYNISFQHFLFNPNIDDLYPFDDFRIVNNGSINEKIKTLDEDVIFIGHEHKAFQIDIENKNLIDVGSSGCTKNDNTFYTIASFDDNSINIEKINLIYNRKEFETIFKHIDYPEKEIIGKIFFGINN